MRSWPHFGWALVQTTRGKASAKGVAVDSFEQKSMVVYLEIIHTPNYVILIDTVLLSMIKIH